MVELPSVVVNPRWRIRSWFMDVCTGALVGITGLFASIGLLSDPNAGRVRATGTIVASVAAMGFSVWRGFRGRAEENKFVPIEEPKDIVGGVEGIHAQLCKVTGRTAPDLRVRVVVHKVLWNQQRTEPVQLEQVIRYFGDDGGAVGRKSSVHCGIVGLTARMADTFYTGKRVGPDLKAYRDELVEKWGFTYAEANERSADRWSWMAVPLLQPTDQTAYGIVFLDSEDVEFFDRDEVKKAVVDAVGMMANTMNRVYDRSK